MLIAAASATLVACGPYYGKQPTAKPESSGCEYDTQCKGDRICEKRRCVAGPVRSKTAQEPAAEAETPPPMKLPGDCYEGNIQDCYDLGMKWVFGIGGPEDPGQARAYFHKACQGGHIFGCMMLGLLLEEKSSGKPEGKKCRVMSVEHYEDACEGGDAQACHRAAQLLDGQPLYKPARDRKRARALYERACEGGVEQACKKTGK
jgi:TPR repeat protein